MVDVLCIMLENTIVNCMLSAIITSLLAVYTSWHHKAVFVNKLPRRQRMLGRIDQSISTVMFP